MTPGLNFRKACSAVGVNATKTAPFGELLGFSSRLTAWARMMMETQFDHFAKETSTLDIGQQPTDS